MYISQSNRQTVELALAKNEVSYDEIRYNQTGKVSIRIEITDAHTIKLAQVGCFSPLKGMAVKIWDTLGSNNPKEVDEDIEYFLVFSEGKAIAVFNIYPDYDRANSNAQDKAVMGWNEDRSELLLEAAIEVECGNDLDEVVQEVIETHFKGFSVAVKHASIRFRKDILSLLVLDKKDNRYYNYTIIEKELGNVRQAI